VAAASSKGGRLVGGPQQREKRPEGVPNEKETVGPGWLRYATAPKYLRLLIRDRNISESLVTVFKRAYASAQNDTFSAIIR